MIVQVAPALILFCCVICSLPPRWFVVTMDREPYDAAVAKLSAATDEQGVVTALEEMKAVLTIAPALRASVTKQAVVKAAMTKRSASP